MVGSHVFQLELKLFFEFAPSTGPLVRLSHELCLFSLHLKATLLHLYGSLLHPSLVLEIVASVEHIRPLVLLALFQLLSLFV